MSFKQDLIKLGTTNPELRPHIRHLLAGCEKLPEGGMRDNCEAKKNEGGKDDDKKEAADKTAGRGTAIAMELRGNAIELVKSLQQQDPETAELHLYRIVKNLEAYAYMALGDPQLRMLLTKASDHLDAANEGMLSSGNISGAPVR